MTRASEPTLLEVAYELLSLYGPLNVEQMAVAAANSGYLVSGWEFQAEIEEHLLVYGDDSPFIEVGLDKFGLAETPPDPEVNNAHLENILPAAVALSLAAILALSIMIGNLGFKRDVNSIYLPAALVGSIYKHEVAHAAETSSLALPDLDWWFDHAINQMNAETQTVARQYLFNPYNTCGPAVVSLLVNYYRAKFANSGEQITTSNVIKEANHRLGFFVPPHNSGLLTLNQLHIMLEMYGLQQAYPTQNSTLMTMEELLERVRQGQPVIAGMRYSYQDGWRYLPAGGSGLYNHFVIIVGLEQTDDQEYLWIANTHPGKYDHEDQDAVPVRVSVSEFWQSWALKDGSELADHGHAAFYYNASK
jgi:hypothetical protein